MKLHRLVRSSAWLFMDRFFRIGVGFLVGVVIARHYGPAAYGQLAYVVATASLLGSFANVGLDEIAPRDLAAQDLGVASPDVQKTAIILRLCAETIAYTLLLAFMAATQGFTMVFWLSAIYGGYFLLQSTDILEYRLRVDGEYGPIAKLRSSASLISAGAKLAAVYYDLPLTWIAVAMLVEYALATAWYARLARRRAWWSDARFNIGYAKNVLSRSGFLIITGFLAALQLRIDSLMIEHILGWEPLGQYSAALKIMELFDTGAIVLSIVLVPEFARKTGTQLTMLARRAYLSGLLIYLLSIPVMFLVWQLFPLVYGPFYTEGQAIMPYLFIRPLFILMGFLRTGLAVAEGRYAALPIYALSGCLLSGILGWLLIPLHGLTGAAIASMASLLLSNMAVDLLIYRRHLAWILTCPMEIPGLLRGVRP